ncbi:MAG TPA: hypothetical protein VKS78_17615 [Roseiarcus sp.]|nr:hypothetical protein [Roseiarcus sp.]
MSHLVRISAGVSLAALGLALGFAFWPQLDKSAALGKPPVEQPVFVARAAAIKSDPATTTNVPMSTPAATPAAASDGDAALAKLAVALRTNAQAAPASTPELGAARGLVATNAADPPPVSDEARRFCAQGLVALAQGDIVGARAFLQRAAAAGDGRALLALGETFDPVTLARMGARGIRGDAAIARDYYTKALAAGVSDARERMASLVSAQ